MKVFLGPLSRLYAHIDPDPEVVCDVVHAWQRAQNKQLPHALNWDESPTAPFDVVEVGEWPADGPDQLIKPDIWLPGDHDLLFQTLDLDEHEVTIGSSQELLRVLEKWTGTGALARIARRSVDFSLPLTRVVP